MAQTAPRSRWTDTYKEKAAPEQSLRDGFLGADGSMRALQSQLCPCQDPFNHLLVCSLPRKLTLSICGQTSGLGQMGAFLQEDRRGRLGQQHLPGYVGGGELHFHVGGIATGRCCRAHVC